MTAPTEGTAPPTDNEGAAFVVRQRTLHVVEDDGWCSCGFPHCGTRMLLDHLDRAEARIAAALAELLRGGQLAADVRRAAIAVLQGKPVPVGEVR
ncbi:hypothetical protein [Amycolatopsis sp. cmx-4-68]|uniref:hypothetical protein n=1 Tax=Amycolatopsis sp. cmx-4-68 TaxID=2790938 RepID=UPI003979A71B